MKHKKFWIVLEILILLLAVGAAVYVGVTSKKEESQPTVESKKETEPGKDVTERETPTESRTEAPTETTQYVPPTPTEPRSYEPSTIPHEREETTVPETQPEPTQPAPTQPTPALPDIPTAGGDSGSGKTVVIDAGHRANGGWSEKEPNGPGSTVMKAKLTTGTACTVDGVYYTEHEVNLKVALKLQKELEARGYTVIQVRTGGESDLSNADRAVLANNAHADVFIRIHCNGAENTSVNGVMTYTPSPANPYMQGLTYNGTALTSASMRLASVLGNVISQYCGCRNGGVLYGDDMTGINWCQVPVTIVEMGFMSNPDEAKKLVSDDYQNRMAAAMAEGIDKFLK